MEVLISIAGKAAEYTVDPIAHQLNYLFKHSSNFQNLKDQIEKLEDARGRVQHSVEEERRNAKEIEADVLKWLASVDNKLTENAPEKLEKAKNKCFLGLCPNLKSRYRLSKRAVEEARAITHLLEEGKFHKVSYSPAMEGVVTKGYNAFQSRTKALEGVMEALGESSVRIIGIHGMAGVGKTTLAKEVAARVKEEHLFDEVAMAVVSHNPDTRKIQGEIADMLGLHYDKETISGRQMQLRERLLKTEKKILIVLDDLWQKLDLEEIGISFQDAAAQISSTAGCKLLLTSRSSQVLDLVDAERSFGVEILSQEESMILFEKIVGDLVGKSDDYECIANELVAKCAGLPVAILAIANALKRRDLSSWKDALRRLRKAGPNMKEMQQSVNSTIELSYNLLESEEAKSILLLCSLHPQGLDIHVSDLLQCGVALDILEDIDTLEDATISMNELVRKLKASSLLLEGKGCKWVKMHDLIRDVSISIASKNKGMWVIKDGNHLKELLKKGNLKGCTAISLPHSSIPDLSDVDCSNLELLMLLNKDPSFQVSDTFFKDMNKLKVLSVTGMSFPSLPLSFLSLTNLQALRLCECKLSEIGIIGNLKTLDVLSFKGSSIEQLPVEIAELTRLKLFDLSECWGIEVIPANVIAKLCRLEELLVGDSFDRWDVEGNAQLAELRNLSSLSALDVYIPNAQIMPQDLFLRRLERYKIAIGPHPGGYNQLQCARPLNAYNLFTTSKASKALKLEIDIGNGLHKGIEMLVKKAEELLIERFKGAKDILSGLDKEGFPHLRYLTVQKSSEIKWIVSSMGMGLALRKAFPVLETMHLHELSNVENICHGELKTESFSQLTTIEIEICGTLKNLFSFSIAKNLNQLQQISVWRCENITEIVAGENDDDNEILEFRGLCSLSLDYLPKLKSFFSQENTGSSSSGRGESASHYMNRGSNGVTLFNSKVYCPALRELNLKGINLIEKIWHDDQIPMISLGVQSLTSLTLFRCDKLKYVLTSSMVNNFVQLKTLVVSHCDEMQGIIEEVILTEEGISSNIMVFPKLDTLTLLVLPNLKRFCCGINPIIFPSLRELRIRICSSLNAFHFDGTSVGDNISLDHNLHVPFFNEKVILPALEELEIQGIDNLERLWPNQLSQHSFSKLTSIVLHGCRKLLHVFPSSMLTRLQGLNTLRIWSCESLEEIIFESHSQEEDSSSSAMQSHSPQPIQSDVITFAFPNLTFLFLFDLPNLKGICHKMRTTIWPSLKEMTVSGCHKVEILFASQETRGKTSQQPLFWVNQFTFPNLNELTLGWNAGMKEIWHCYGHGQQLLSRFFCNLKVVTLYDYPEQVTVLPSYLFPLLSLPSLQKHEMKWCSFKEIIFQSEGGVGKLIEEVQSSKKDEGDSSTSNTQLPGPSSEGQGFITNSETDN
ncbi:hypothetical protein like AT4G27190 [Hibiscus trionum]|uniref:AAA+ ATPase domain-containing protein n=1 Tax=Hibiscus trionum TaxID=183268 RepID=A0A9W7GTN2_HIBTR|nr:hypothetical protein like AT4G27190 [Hibiscus trionum]